MKLFLYPVFLFFCLNCFLFIFYATVAICLLSNNIPDNIAIYVQQEVAHSPLQKKRKVACYSAKKATQKINENYMTKIHKNLYSPLKYLWPSSIHSQHPPKRPFRVNHLVTHSSFPHSFLCHFFCVCFELFLCLSAQSVSCSFRQWFRPLSLSLLGVSFLND